MRQIEDRNRLARRTERQFDGMRSREAVNATGNLFDVFRTANHVSTMQNDGRASFPALPNYIQLEVLMSAMMPKAASLRISSVYSTRMSLRIESPVLARS